MPSRFDQALRTPEDIRRFEAERPLDDRLPGRSVLDAFIASATRHPDRTAITILMTGAPDEQPRRVSYAQLLGLIRRAANLFASLGGPRPAHRCNGRRRDWSRGSCGRIAVSTMRRCTQPRAARAE